MLGQRPADLVGSFAGESDAERLLFDLSVMSRLELESNSVKGQIRQSRRMMRSVPKSKIPKDYRKSI